MVEKDYLAKVSHVHTLATS